MERQRKLISALIMVLSAVVVVLALLQFFGVWNGAINFFEPLIGVVMVLLAIQSWDSHRGAAIACLCVGAFIFAIALVSLLL